MSSNSSNAPLSVVQAAKPPVAPKPPRSNVPMKKRILYSISFPVWVFLGFMLAQAIVLAVIAILVNLNVPLGSVNEIILNSVGGAIIYALAIVIVVGLPWVIKKKPTSLEELGLQRLPRWVDIALAPAGMIVYLILTSILMTAAMALLTFVDFSQAQETGFAQIATQPEYILAFISLVLVAPFAEEVLFRGYLFGKLRKYTPLWVSILITSALFALVHFQWNVAIDVFALSIVLCLLRVVSGSIWPSILLHMLKNGVAFYFLFINPSLLSTLGG